MTTKTPAPTPIDPTSVEAIANAIAERVYQRLRADLLMGDDMLVTEDEVAAIMKRNPEALTMWRRIHMGPQFVRIAGSRQRLYRIGAVKHYLDEVKAGAMHAKAMIEAQNEYDLKTGQLALK